MSVTAAMVVIGNEILSGRTRDANLPHIGRRLDELGLILSEVRVVGDEVAAIVAAVNACRTAYEYVFTTGGIGPTHDDVTARAIAEVFAVPLEPHPEAAKRLESYYAARGLALNSARRRMADMPRGAQLIDNPVSQAPGFRIGNVFVLAGVPVIAEAMFESLSPDLRRGAAPHCRTIVVAASEGDFAEELAALQCDHPDVVIGSYPFFEADRHGVRLVLRATDPEALARAATALAAALTRLGSPPIEETGA